MLNQKQYKRNGGAAMMILLIFFIVISITILLGIVTPVVREFQISGDSLDSRKSYFMAESGIEDIMYRVKNSMDVGTLGDNRTLFLDGTNFPIPTILIDGFGGQKSISIQGDVKNRQRTIGVELTTSSGVSFNYGVLVGQGGVYLDSGTVNGNLYANGPITASSSGGNIITGTAISANNPNSGTNESNGTGTPAYNVTFGNANATEDIGQSFQVANSDRLSKVQFYIKKKGSPSDAVVKIVNDSGGKPGTTVLASGTLSASAVPADPTYGWVNVSFTTNPTLNADTTYWLVVDASTSNSKYYIIGASNGGYSDGLGKIGKQGGTWIDTTPVGLDYYFNIYLGGETGLIQGDGLYNQLHVGTVSGTAQAHTVNAVNSTGNIYCQVGANNNKACISQSDPVYVSFPISDANIEAWQEDALSGGVYTGNYAVGWQNATLGPKKIAGNLTISGGGILTVTGNMWVTGNLVLDGGGLIKLATSYGANDAVIVVDGTISISGGGHATGSGTAGSYIMLLTKSTSTSAAIINGGAGAVIVYAPNGTLSISGGASLKEATGYKMSITGGSSITYESGLSDNNFSSGPSGSWSIDSWGESQ